MKRRSASALPFSPAGALALLVAGLLLAALTLMIRPALARDRSADDLCGEDVTWSHTDFGKRKGTTVRDIQEIHQLAPRGTWHIDAGENGSVKLLDWGKNEVQICAHLTAWARDKARAEKLLRSIHVENAGGRLHAEGPEQTKDARWGVSYKIYAPKNSDLEVQTVNGAISLEGIRGQILLHTENGPLQIAGAGGDVEGRTTNGPLSVTLTGTRWQGRGLDAETTNGPVQLSIPEGYSAQLTTGTDNGPMAGAFAGVKRGHRPGRRHVTTVLGSGGAPIRVVTSNGPIVVNAGGSRTDNGDDEDDNDDE